MENRALDVTYTFRNKLQAIFLKNMFCWMLQNCRKWNFKTHVLSTAANSLSSRRRRARLARACAVSHKSWHHFLPKSRSTRKRLLLKAGVNLNGIFAPLNTGLVQISRLHFKQSKNSMLKTWIYVIGCFVNFLAIFGYIWVEIVFFQRIIKI